MRRREAEEDRSVVLPNFVISPPSFILPLLPLPPTHIFRLRESPASQRRFHAGFGDYVQQRMDIGSQALTCVLYFKKQFFFLLGVLCCGK